MRKRLRTKTTVAEIISAAPAPTPAQAQKLNSFSPGPPLPPKALPQDAAAIVPLQEARPQAAPRATGTFSDQWQNFKECIQIASDAHLRNILQTFCDKKTSSKVVISDADVDLLRQSLDTPALLLALVKKFRDVPM